MQDQTLKACGDLCRAEEAANQVFIESHRVLDATLKKNEVDGLGACSFTHVVISDAAQP